jgi:asparagine synthase (glutamine-hydrolysing)
VSKSGAVLTWDGRLDNREELVAQLKKPPSSEWSDVSLVASAYERWGTSCFPKLAGDWALSVWNSNDRSVTLARDPVGPRHLYYTIEKHRITWSTILDPLVLFAERRFALDEECMAGWFSSFPASHLTPFADIRSVEASSFVRLERERQTTRKFWDFSPSKRISYRNDADYEEHFRVVFAQSVRRRVRSDTPVLAELSGGIDSSSIVCMADALLARSPGNSPNIDTISYYDDSEPDWNERPYFTKVEEKRGRVGCHINACGQATILSQYCEGRFAATPWSALKASEAQIQFGALSTSGGNRVLLSGLGGDEVLGGVPTPIPELADLLARMHFGRLGKQIVRWALAKRKPVLDLAAETLRAFLPAGFLPVRQHNQHSRWLLPSFRKRNRAALAGYRGRFKLIGPLPTFQENLATLNGLRRQIGCFVLPRDPPHEKRFPYLDRDLLEFLYAIPREQILRPGQRRSLMRRALVGIVPDEILNRKRKAFVSRSLSIAMSSEWDLLVQMTQRMVTGSLQMVDPKLFREALENARHSPEPQMMDLARTAAIETWLASLEEWTLARPVRRSKTGAESAHRADDFASPVRRSFLSAENNLNTERR